MQRNPYTRYSREFKLEAVRQAALGEKPKAQIAPALGIRFGHLRDWRLPNCAEAMGWTPPHLIGIDVPDWKCQPPVDREKESTMKLIRVGVDLAKNVFQVHGVARNEKAVWRRKLTRESWLKVLLETVEPGCEIGMESCGGAHHWARRLQAHGFKVRLVAPQFVKPCEEQQERRQ